MIVNHPRRRRRRLILWALLGVLTTSATLASIRLPTTAIVPNAAIMPAISVQGPQLLGLTDLLYFTSYGLVGSPVNLWNAERTDQLARRRKTIYKELSPAQSPQTNLLPTLMTNLVEALPGRHLSIRTDTTGNLRELIYRAKLQQRLRVPGILPDAAFTAQEEKPIETRLAYVTGHIDRSFFESGKEAGLSDPLILGLTHIFGWDVDFALDVRSGDRFSVIYEEKYWQGHKVADGEIVAAEYINQGHIYRAIGARDTDGKMIYYSPTGRKLQRMFLRTPVIFSRVTSFFSGARYHPILKMWRAHNGVDYAAPPGTPVQATASGRVVSIGWKGSYGRTIVLDHGNSYSTLYAHLLRYSAELREGQHVEQGQIIGYVGRTGLATGPHLHYELQIDGHYKNPLTFEFPAGDYIASSMREEYWRAARLWIARLDFISDRSLALSSNFSFQ